MKSRTHTFYEIQYYISVKSIFRQLFLDFIEFFHAPIQYHVQRFQKNIEFNFDFNENIMKRSNEYKL